MVGSRPRGQLPQDIYHGGKPSPGTASRVYIHRNVDYKHTPYVFGNLVFESDFNKLKGLLLGRVSSKKGLGMFWGVLKKERKIKLSYF